MHCAENSRHSTHMLHKARNVRIAPKRYAVDAMSHPASAFSVYSSGSSGSG